MPTGNYSNALSQMPFIESVVLALILGEQHSNAHRKRFDLLDGGLAWQASHSTDQLQ